MKNIDINCWVYTKNHDPILNSEFIINDTGLGGGSKPRYIGLVGAQFFSASNEDYIINQRIIGKDTLDNSQINLIVLPICNIKFFETYIKNLHKLKDFVSSTNTKIIIAWLRESLDTNDLNDLENLFEKYLVFNNFKENKLKVAINSYKEYDIDLKIKNYLECYDSFPAIIGHTIRTWRYEPIKGKFEVKPDLQNDQGFVVYNDIKNYDYSFAFTLGTLKSRGGRYLAVYELIKRNLWNSKDIFKSHFWNKSFDIEDFKKTMLPFIEGNSLNKDSMLKTFYDHEKDIFKNRTYDYKGDLMDDNRLPYDWDTPSQVFKSLINVIFESRPEVQSITEKTYKPLMWGQPHLWHAYPNTKKYLEEQGYNFYPWIDYSFDECEDQVERLSMLFDEIERLRKDPNLFEYMKQSKDINQHNRLTFFHNLQFNEKFLRIVKY